MRLVALKRFFAGGERKKMPQEVYVREYTPEKHFDSVRLDAFKRFFAY